MDLSYFFVDISTSIIIIIIYTLSIKVIVFKYLCRSSAVAVNFTFCRLSSVVGNIVFPLLIQYRCIVPFTTLTVGIGGKNLTNLMKKIQQWKYVGILTDSFFLNHAFITHRLLFTLVALYTHYKYFFYNFNGFKKLLVSLLNWHT